MEDSAVAGNPAIEQEISRMFRVRRTVLEMLRDRGYYISETEEDLGLTLPQFRATWGQHLSRDQLTTLKQHSTQLEDRIYVFYPNDGGKALGVKSIKQYAEQMEGDNIHKAILILRKGLTSYGQRAVKQLQRYRIEYFLENELLVNITHHELVPRHEVLDEKDKKELLNRYKLKEAQLPRIMKTDPIARYYGLELRQVFKITRPSETAGRYVTYRICV